MSVSDVALAAAASAGAALTAGIQQVGKVLTGRTQRRTDQATHHGTIQTSEAGQLWDAIMADRAGLQAIIRELRQELEDTRVAARADQDRCDERIAGLEKRIRELEREGRDRAQFEWRRPPPGSDTAGT